MLHHIRRGSKKIRMQKKYRQNKPDFSGMGYQQGVGGKELERRKEWERGSSDEDMSMCIYILIYI